jgi:branched-subunit amino acid aminotransferase/4-amino-4-deoxychorismate lyase
MQTKFVIKNGQLILSTQAGISVYSKAMFFDFCVYSNIKVVGGKMFLPELEIIKLFESAGELGIEFDHSAEELLAWAQLLIKENKLVDALIRLLLIGQEQDRPAELFMFAVGLTFYPDKFYKEGVKLVTYRGERFMPSVKSKNLLMSYLAYNEAHKAGALDALLVDNDGNVREGTRSSFFVIKNNTLIMPPIHKVLGGLTKKIILVIATKILDIKEEDIPLSNIADYDEYFISATTMKVMPVSQINDIKVSGGVGEKTKELMKLFKQIF